jgi:TnpA family transposase
MAKVFFNRSRSCRVTSSSRFKRRSSSVQIRCSFGRLPSLWRPSSKFIPSGKAGQDQMIKYATALRLGTAETEAILRRFALAEPQQFQRMREDLRALTPLIYSNED